MRIRAAFSLLLCLFLAGCSGKTIYPEKAEDGADWDQAWQMHGSVLGVAEAEGVALIENYAVLTMRGISSSRWGVGEPTASGDGEDDRYDAEVYVLAVECEDEQAARQAVEDWEKRIGETWLVQDTWEETHNGQTYTLRRCDAASQEGAFRRETAAFAQHGSSAVSVELACRETYDGDAPAVLSGFLDNCHYAKRG